VGRLVVLGAGGMLGQQVELEARKGGLEVVTVSRNGDFRFTYAGGNLAEVTERVGLSSGDTLVNCIGWIPQKATGNLPYDLAQADLLNSQLISELSAIQAEQHFQWVQILTDCVFSGKQGGYVEDSYRDAEDIYGKSKIRGELLMTGAVGIRCSIIGADSNSSAGLYSWFKSVSAGGGIAKGFVNALWNGVSTNAFAKLCCGIHRSGGVKPGRYHWIPDGATSKYELLREFALNLHSDASRVEPQTLAVSVDRTLATLDKKRNVEFWKLAGYPGPMSVNELCAEFINEDLSSR